MTGCWRVLQVWNRGASGNTFAQGRTAACFLSQLFPPINTNRIVPYGALFLPNYRMHATYVSRS